MSPTRLRAATGRDDLPDVQDAGGPGAADLVPAKDVDAAAATISVCFSTSHGLVSRLICWVTRSRVSHALLTFRSATLDKVLVMQATGLGFHLWPWDKWRRKNKLVARFALAVPPERQLVALRDLARNLGAEYDTWSLFAFLRRRWGKRARNPWNSPRKLICSEVVARFLSSCDLRAFDDAGSFTPADLYGDLSADHETFRLVEGRPVPDGTRRRRRHAQP
jgi:hypothetical protein